MLYDHPVSSLFTAARGKIPIDTSSRQEKLVQYSSEGTPSLQVLGGIGAINHGTTASMTFDVDGVNQNIRLDRSFVEVEMKGYAATVLAPNAPVVLTAASCGIPWNTATALINNAKLFFNKTNASVEEYNTSAEHANMMRMLTNYSQESLDAMTDRLFTPTIEEILDISTGISTATQTRTTRNFISNTAVATVKKLIYLPDLFDCCSIPAVMPLDRIRMEITFKQSTAILFKKATLTDTLYLGITGARLFMCQSDPTPAMEEELRKRMTMSVPLMMYSYKYYDTISQYYNPNSDYVDSSVKNLQGVICAFTAPLLNGNIGLNPYQYVYNAGAAGATPITSFYATYDDVSCPNTALTLDVNNPQSNSALYALYRNLVNRDRDREIAPAIPATYMLTGKTDAVAYNQYVLLCASFYPNDSFAHLNDAGKRLQVSIKGGVAGTMYVCRIRTRTLAIMNDKSIAVNN